MVGVETAAGINENEMLAQVASLENASEHPLARAMQDVYLLHELQSLGIADEHALMGAAADPDHD